VSKIAREYIALNNQKATLYMADTLEIPSQAMKITV
jgi:hypothetical protein